MCLLLAEFLRDTLRVSARERIPLAEELALTDRFLGIEQVRFGERLQVERHVDERAPRSAGCRRCCCSRCVENAVTHGIAGLLEGGVIRLDVARRDDRLSIAIENPRDADAAAATARRRRARERPQAAGRRCSAPTRGSTRASRPRRFRVELRLPCVTR